ncbi:MAG: fasciclin domain-containing protein, partial [Thermoguttaceae bacterium]|nr:fasciclin domain-containing protein [Thermoguttaceae bacterium]
DAAEAADVAKEQAKAAVEAAKANVEQAAQDAKEKTEAAAEVAKEQLDAVAKEGQAQANAVADAAKDALDGAKANADVAKTPVKPRMYNYNASTLSCVMQCPECAVFSRAIHESGLEELIGGARRITIFAPTDEAFARWPQESLEQLFDCKPALAAIVLNHICPESLSPAELTKLQRLACCCNYDSCVKYCGKKRADELALHCDAIADKTKEQQEVCDRNGGVGLGDGDLCAAASFPAPVVRCVNGYVYPIDRVQVPRGLKVYQALKSQEEQAPEEALEFELVEILIPSETLQPQPEETKDNEEMKKDEEKKNGNGKKENGKNGKNGAKTDEMKAEKETKADGAKDEKEMKDEKSEAKDKDKKDEKNEKSETKDKDKKDDKEKKDKDADDKDDDKDDEEDDEDEKK